MLRTLEEIVERLQTRRTQDTLGFEVSILFDFLDFEHAKQFLGSSSDLTAETWTQANPDRILKTMEEYMSFAWGKANGCRGISAVRSIKHYIAWIWLLGDDEFASEVENQMNNNYQHYGKEILIGICEKYGWDYTEFDEGVRTNE